VRTLASWLVVLLIGCGPVAAPPPPAPVRPAPASAPAAAPPHKVVRAPRAPIALEEYFRTRRIRSASFSHDEKLVAYTSDEGGRIDIWVQPVVGGAARQVTHVRGIVHGFAFSPRSDQLLYEADEGGDELPRLYLTNSQGAKPVELTRDLPAGARTQFVRWADDGQSFLYLSSKRDRRYLDLYEFDMATMKSKLLWSASGRIAFALTSRNHQRFVLIETLSDVDTNLYLVDRKAAGKAPVRLTPHKGEIQYWPTGFSRDAKTLFYTSDAGQEFTALYAMSLAPRTSKPVLKDKWDVEEGDYSRGWRYFYTVTNVDGAPHTVLTETKGKDGKLGKPVKLPAVRGALVPLAFSASDRYLAAHLSSDVAPRTVMVVDLKAGTARPVVDALSPALRGRPMVAGEVVHIPSYDRLPVPAFLYRPAGAGPFPAVIDVHGGPTAQSRREFGVMRQYLVSKGYVVLVPNVRGSTGYGKTYAKLDNLDLGGGPLKDVVACKRWLVQHALVDLKRVVVMGGSYGGYMALAAAAFTPDEFAALIDFFGVSDLKTLVESFPAYWASFATYIYQKFGDPKNPAHAKYQYERSPLNFVDQIVRPILIVQGDKDARVQKSQSDRMVARLRARKTPVHYLVLAGEGHGFSKTENWVAGYRLADRFLDRYIFGDTEVQLP
jgi:dipeptidyl aminopeptidase/acylaminoacyl peptidase